MRVVFTPSSARSRSLGESGLHAGLLIVSFEVFFGGIDLVEDEVTWVLAVFLKEVDQVFRIDRAPGR